jgi:hypothetical protein
MRADPRHRPLPPEPATLLSEGRVMEAIKVLRDSNGLTFRQARDWIDAHIADNPVLGVEIEARQRARRRRIFAWFLLGDAVVAAAVVYYLFYLN